MTKKFRLRRAKCRRCGYKWVPRISSPVVCPRCKSPYWKTKLRVKKEDK